MAALLAIAFGGVYVGSAVVARHRAQAAADLSAAAHLADGASCSQASALAHAMRTNVTRSVVEDLDVVVTAEASVPLERTDLSAARATDTATDRATAHHGPRRAGHGPRHGRAPRRPRPALDRFTPAPKVWRLYPCWASLFALVWGHRRRRRARRRRSPRRWVFASSPARRRCRLRVRRG